MGSQPLGTFSGKSPEMLAQFGSSGQGVDSLRMLTSNAQKREG